MEALRAVPSRLEEVAPPMRSHPRMRMEELFAAGAAWRTERPRFVVVEMDVVGEEVLQPKQKTEGG